MLRGADRVRTVTGVFSPLLNLRSYADPETEQRCRTFFLNAELRRDLDAGLVDFCPWRYTQIHRWLSAPRRFDVAIVMVSPPDASAMCSFGTQVDFLPAFYDRIACLIGIINPNMPQTAGEPGIPLSAFDAIFSYDEPLLSVAPAKLREDPVAATIAANVASLVPDGATIQMGIGRLPQAIVGALTDHRNLRIHSGLVDDNILHLEEAGALAVDVPVVSGAAIGSPRLYAHLDGNDRYSFRHVGHTHDPNIIAAAAPFVAINGALQIDLFGQVNSEASGGRIIASPGGLPEFVRGALKSPGGRAVMAVRARGGKKGGSGIVATVAPPHLVTNGRTDADVVVTEFGVADIRDLPIDRRAEALIGIAAPEDRDMLADRWRTIRMHGFGTL
jgi:acyl-CoA hydrolase